MSMKHFGTTLSETVNAFKSLHAGEGRAQGDPQDRMKAIGRIVISILLLFLATFLFTQEGRTEVASGIVGALTGYWVK